MSYVAQVIVGMVVMGILDVPMIKYVISPTLSRAAPELVAKRPDALAAALFYVGYVSLVVYLSQRFGSDVKDVTVAGALLGLFAYGTYELTNKAVIQGWPWSMVILDILWGTILTAAVAGSAFYALHR